MQYMTIALELLRQRRRMHDQLCRERRLLEAVKLLATELKMRHEAWKEQLSRARPGSDPQQVASAALELALRGLEDSLPPESPADGSEVFSLDEAMAFLRRHTPPG